LAIECITFAADEVDERSAKVVPMGMHWALKFHFAVIGAVLVSFFPFIYRLAAMNQNINNPAQGTLLPAMFNSIRIFSARYLMNAS